MADKDYTSLLGKSSGTSWGELAGAYLTKGKKKDKKARNILIASLIFNAKEAQMQSNALKNLKENDEQKTFQNAGITNKWNAYNKLMEEDESYKANPNFFKLQAEQQFARDNANFPTGNKLLQSEIDFKNKEVSDLEKALKNIHIEKIKTGNITKRLSKEEFYKPFEDYYKGRQEEITSSDNVSLVHKAWDKITNREDKKILTDMQKEQRLNEATRGSFSYLLNPDEITGDAAIALYKPSASKLNTDEAKLNILKLEGVNQEQKNYLINNIGNKEYTKNELQAKIVTLSADYNPFFEKRKTANNIFDKQWEESGKAIPVIDTKEHKDYILRRTNFADVQTGQGDKELNELRSNMFALQDEKLKPNSNPKIVSYLQNKIRDAGVGKIQLMALNTAMASAVDENVLATVKLMNKDTSKSEEDLKLEFMQSTYKSTLDFADSILNVNEQNNKSRGKR